MSDLREALKSLIADIEDYERVNNLAPSPGKPDCWQSVTRAKAALAQPEAVEPVPLVWRDGAPPKPWADEWFIARTTFNDRVVLTALPEEYSYDFKTADDTYIKADRIKQWMQFPDSQFIAPPIAPDERMRRALEIAEDVLSRAPFSTGFWPNGMHPQTGIDIIREALSRADEGKESEGNVFAHGAPEDIASMPDASEPVSLRTASEIEADRCPSDPTPQDHHKAIVDIIDELLIRTTIQGSYIERQEQVKYFANRTANKILFALQTNAGG